MIGGNIGRKNTEPTMKDKLPIIERTVLRAPMLRRGLKGLNIGSTMLAKISTSKNSTEPIMNIMPPANGLTFVKVGHITIDPTVNSTPPLTAKNAIVPCNILVVLSILLYDINISKYNILSYSSQYKKNKMKNILST
jgi:hypothetical protein